MNPLALVGLAAAAGVGLWYYKKNDTTPSVPGQAQGAPTGMVNELTQGKTYAVMVVVAPPEAGKGIPPATVAETIRSFFESQGAKVLMPPTLRDQTENQNFLTGKPSTWVFNMQWASPEKYITGSAPWLLNAAFVYLPVAS